MPEDTIDGLRRLQAEARERSGECAARLGEARRVSRAIEAAMAAAAIAVGACGAAEAMDAAAAATLVLFGLLGTALVRLSDPRRSEIERVAAAWTRHEADAGDLIARHERDRSAGAGATLGEWTQALEAEVRRTRHATDALG